MTVGAGAPSWLRRGPPAGARARIECRRSPIRRRSSPPPLREGAASAPTRSRTGARSAQGDQHAAARNVGRLPLSAGSDRPNLDQLLAEVLPLSRPMKASGALSMPFTMSSRYLSLPAFTSGRHLLPEALPCRQMVGDDEARDGGALDQQQAPVGAGARLHLVVVRDQPAQGHAREVVELGHHGVLHGAADILEVDVDAVGAGGARAP